MTTIGQDIEKHLLRVVFGSLALVLPTIAGSNPNQNSVADFEACLVDSATVRVCSSKELSNVVVQCANGGETSYFYKHDDLDDLESPSAQYLETPYEGVFQCPQGEDILAVFVKAGSGKHSGGIDGAPRGLGAVWTPQTCPVECPEPNLEEGEEETEEPDLR